MKCSRLAERAFRHLHSAATATDISGMLGVSPASARKALARLEAAQLVTSVLDKGKVGRGALIFSRVPGAIFSHAALRDHSAPPRKAHADVRAMVERVFESVPVGEANAIGIAEIIAKIDSRRTPEHMRRVLKSLAQRGLVVLANGCGRLLFHRPEGAVFSDDGLVPQVKMRIGNWYRDRHGNFTRQIRAVESTEDSSSIAAARVNGRLGGLAAACSRSRNRKPASPRNARLTPAGETLARWRAAAGRA
jgi:predicted transcriptional regulator